MMKMTTLLLGAALAIVSFSTPALAVTMYGALGNFDAINDTGSTAHGFEIELDGCAPSNIYSTFGSPYNRYGTPTITSVGGNTYVRWESAYDATNGWAAGTPFGSIANTGGHSLYIGSGYPGFVAGPTNVVPGDHFGVALNVNPTNTIYHWLLDGGNGTLTPAGTSVKIPVPVLAVVPPANPVNQAAVQAVVQAPPPENQAAFGEAIWAKVFTTVVQSAGPVELDQLLLGNAAVPPETETEVEWQLLQAAKAGFGERGDALDLGNGNESVTRRYEFYKYTGAFDPVGEATNEDPKPFDAVLHPGGYDPIAFPNGVVGDFIGGQNAAINLAPFLAPEPGTLTLLGISLAGMAWYGWRRRKATMV